MPAPEDQEIAQLTVLLAERIPKLLRRRGLGPEANPEESDPLLRDEPWLAGLYAASVTGRIATGPDAGQRVNRTGDRIDPESLEALESPRCASVSGFSLHANISVPAGDRLRLERLARYCARPPLAIDRLEPVADGRILYRFKRPWRNGTTHLVFEPAQFIEKLAALVPAPKTHLVRYHGILAPSAKWRADIVPAVPDSQSGTAGHSGCTARLSITQDIPVAGPDLAPPLQPAHPRYYTWAELMRRVFVIDVLECPRCSGRMRILAAIHPPETTRKILECLGLPSRSPPLASAMSEDTPSIEWS